MLSRKGFTLIELLIVVAIIAILAAIAVPNFLEAQMRAKASRIKSDLRTAVTSLEAYAVDHNKYPVPRYIAQIQNPKNSGAQFMPGGYHPFGPAGGPLNNSALVGGLTSPVSYITSVMKDTFAINVFDSEHEDIVYQNVDIWCEPGTGIPLAGAEATAVGGGGGAQANRFTGTTARDLRNAYGSWIVRSIGPDKSINGANIPYDPTNGTVSYGDIYRTQRRDKNTRSVGGE